MSDHDVSAPKGNLTAKDIKDLMDAGMLVLIPAEPAPIAAKKTAKTSAADKEQLIYQLIKLNPSWSVNDILRMRGEIITLRESADSP